MAYNPGISYQGGELLARGLESAGASIGRGVEQMQRGAEEAKRLRKALAGLMPEQKAQFETMGLGELRGATDAIALKRADAIYKQQEQQHEASMKRMAREESQAAQDIAAESEFARRIKELSGAPADVQVPLAPPRKMTPEMLLEVAGQSGMNPGQMANVAQIARTLHSMAPEEQRLALGKILDLPGVGKLIGTGGAPILDRDEKPIVQPVQYNGKDLGIMVGQKYIPMSELEPDTSVPNLIPMTDPEGNETDFYWNPRTGRAERKTASNPFMDALAAKFAEDDPARSREKGVTKKVAEDKPATPPAKGWLGRMLDKVKPEAAKTGGLKEWEGKPVHYPRPGTDDYKNVPVGSLFWHPKDKNYQIKGNG